MPEDRERKAAMFEVVGVDMSGSLYLRKMIKSFKELLGTVLRKARLNYKGLSTIVCDCAAVLNSRPLTMMIWIR